MSGSKDTDPCFRFYRLMAECDLVALHSLSTSEGRCLGTPEKLLKFPHSIDALPYEVRTQLAQKKLNSFKGISAAPGIEGSVSTSANHKDNEPAVTSSDNWPGGLFRTSPKHWDGAPDVVLSSATPSTKDGMTEVNNQNGSLSNRP